jgi:signal transduction histidine kinase
MGDDALREVDEMLAALDAGEFGEAARAYAEPGRLATALEDLVAAMRARGLRVRARLGELPRSPALTATTYRVAHEGLANAMRHAPGAQVELVVERGDDGYVVRVSDDGPGTSDLRGAGFGLDGLSERVAACEGSFRAGPGAQGGFLVEAVLPVSALREVRG